MNKKLCMKTPTTQPMAHCHSLLCPKINKDVENINEEQVAVCAMELANLLEGLPTDIYLIKDKYKLKRLIKKQREKSEQLEYLYNLFLLSNK